MLENKRAEFVTLFKEFVHSYLPTPDGQDHVKRYAKERQEGCQNFEAIVEAWDHGALAFQASVGSHVPADVLAHGSGKRAHPLRVLRPAYFSSKAQSRSKETPTG